MTITQFLDSVLGSYDPVLDPVTGSVASGVAGLDWPYIITAALFIVVVFCVLKIIGSVISKIGG